MMSPAVLRVFLTAAFLGAFLRLADCHFSKLHLAKRLVPQMGLGGLPEGSTARGGPTRPSLQVSEVTPSAPEVRIGERLELECEAFGGPPPTIQWLHDGQPIGQDMDEAKSFNNLLSAEAINLGNSLGSGLPKVTSNLVPLESGIAKVISRLVIDCALPVHQGMYSCVAVSGTDAEVSKPTTVYVDADHNLSALLSACQHAPPRITSFAKVVMDVSGTDVTLPCGAEGSPRPAIFWKDNNNQLIANGGAAARRNRYKILPNGSLMILKVRWSDMGLYTCVAESETGRDNATTFLYPLRREVD